MGSMARETPRRTGPIERGPGGFRAAPKQCQYGMDYRTEREEDRRSGLFLANLPVFRMPFGLCRRRLD
jgi:hypothetical protein